MGAEMWECFHIFVLNAGEPNTAQKIKFSIKDFFSKCDQIHSFLAISSFRDRFQAGIFVAEHEVE